MNSGVLCLGGFAEAGTQKGKRKCTTAQIVKSTSRRTILDSKKEPTKVSSAALNVLARSTLATMTISKTNSNSKGNNNAY